MKARKMRTRLVGWIFFLVLLAAGLLAGTESTLALSRDERGAVTAVNAWRFAGRWPLVWRTAENVHEARMQEVELGERERRSSANRDMWGMLVRREELVILGTTQISYPYGEDLSLIRSFLKNPSNRLAELHHPIDIRRQVASVVLLALVGLSALGWIWEKVAGRRALAGAKIKPLPPALGSAVFILGIAVVFWFFIAGHRVVGPLATKKVELLFSAAASDDAAGVAEAIRKGVFLDARDGQSRTALMTAAQAGAAHAARALLQAGAHPSLRDLEDATALTIAIKADRAEIARELLDAGADIEAADLNGRTALHWAAEARDASVLKRLIGLGANVNQPDAHGWTPIFFAAAGGSAESVQTLLAAGADGRRKLPDGRAPRDIVFADPQVGPLLDASRGVVELPVSAPR